MNHVIVALTGVADGFRQMVIECQVHARHIRQIGGDVVVADRDLTVLHILRVDEQDLFDQVQVLEQHRTHQAVEITTGYQTIFLIFGHERTFHTLSSGSLQNPSYSHANVKQRK
jgi:hypothetical protein